MAKLSSLILEEKEPFESSIFLEPWMDIIKQNSPVNIPQILASLLESIEQNNLNKIFKKYNKNEDEDFVLNTNGSTPDPPEKKQKFHHKDEEEERPLSTENKQSIKTCSEKLSPINEPTKSSPPFKATHPAEKKTQKSASVPKKSSLSVHQRLQKKLNARKKN